MRWCKPAAASGLLDHGRDAKDGAGDALALAGGGVPSSSSSDKLSGWCGGGGVHVGQESVMVVVVNGEWRRFLLRIVLATGHDKNGSWLCEAMCFAHQGVHARDFPATIIHSFFLSATDLFNLHS